MPTTTSYNRGTVVLLPFPFSDQSATKVRPAVIANPAYPSEDLLVVALTSVAAGLRPGEFAIQYWREAGLIYPTFGKRAIASVSSKLALRVLGSLRSADLAQLDTALRNWFGL